MPPSARHARRCRLTGPGAVCCTAACRRWVLGTVPRRRWGRHAVATRRRRVRPGEPPGQCLPAWGRLDVATAFAALPSADPPERRPG